MKIKKTLIDIFEIVFISIGIVFVLTNFIFIPVNVEGSSMESTLQNDDFGLSFIITKNLGVNRFDIVVIQSEKTPVMIVKRVIGMPNEIIEYKDNKLYVDGEMVEESFLNDSAKTDDFSYTLADDEYFVLGDNRGISKDSRYYGVFKKDEFVSSHVFVLWPLDHFGLKWLSFDDKTMF